MHDYSHVSYALRKRTEEHWQIAPELLNFNKSCMTLLELPNNKIFNIINDNYIQIKNLPSYNINHNTDKLEEDKFLKKLREKFQNELL